MDLAMPQVDNDYEFLKELLDDFLEDFKSRESKIIKFATEVKTDSKAYDVKKTNSLCFMTDAFSLSQALRKDAHAVKGSALNLGLSRVSSYAKTLEEKATEVVSSKVVTKEKIDTIKNLCKKLQSSTAEVSKEHEKILKKHEQEHG
eukprot:1337221-Amorphochlora_amoeboformis.AAC.1